MAATLAATLGHGVEMMESRWDSCLRISTDLLARTRNVRLLSGSGLTRGVALHITRAEAMAAACHNYYFGGMIRSMQTARMAQAYGKKCTPHMSGGGLGFLYMMHFVSALPNATPHHEFKGLGTSVQFECKTSPLKVIDGKLKVPTGPGLGVDIDPSFVSKHQVVKA